MTVKFRGLECEASIDGANIVLFCIEEGKAQEFTLLNAGYLLERKAQDAVAYQDRDEDGSYWTYNDSEVSEYIEDHMGEFIDSFTGEVLESTEHLN
jgi:hypothetical protein